MTVEEIVDKHWSQMFEELTDFIGDDMDELLIEVRLAPEGKTIRCSWQDRNKMLRGEYETDVG